MTTQVLYRKWRPQRFADVVGQAPIVQTLRQAVTQGRVGHAYLFCGPRGTGKTTTARILAKALNCASPQEGEPDNSCAFCTAVMEGFALDMVEIDAASHRGIEDARSLRERVFGSGPAQGRYKVYIVDEVHMLTEPAFNALLKTLEEPAPWAIFVLCTTEPHKVPATIISRCQRFDFRRIATQDVASCLERIAGGEGFQFEPAALRTIARAAWGSLRDACNILEQLVTSHGPQVTLAGVQELLGISSDQRALDLALHCLAGNVPQGLDAISSAASSGADLRAFHHQVVDYLRAALHLKAGIDSAVDYPSEVVGQLRTAAQAASWERLLAAVKHFGGANLRASEAPSPLPLELALVETCQGPVGEVPRRPEAAVSGAKRAPAPSIGGAPSVPPLAPRTVKVMQENPSPAEARRTQPRTTEAAPPARPREQAPSASIPAEGTPLADAQWSALVKTLKGVRGKGQMDVGALLNSSRGRYLANGELVLMYGNRSNMERLQAELEDPACRQQVAQAIRQCVGGDYSLHPMVGQPGSSPRSGGHLVRAAMSLGARIVEEKEETA